METKELYQKNIKAYLDIIDRFWDFSSESREYIVKRLQSNWEFPEEYKRLFKENSTDNDQRIRWNIDITDKNVSQIFSQQDEGWTIFQRNFNHGIALAQQYYNCHIGYNEYCNNKAMFKNNLTKVKKIFEVIYSEYIDYAKADLGIRNAEDIENKIIKVFESIGTVKKPVKKLQLVLSLNPVDWLLCSTNSSISSCLNLENSGGGHKYFAGLPFLCGDPNRSMLYVCDGEKKSYRGIEVDQPITRSWVMLNENSQFGIIKWYCNEYFNTQTINKITGINNFISHLNSNGKYPLDFVYLKSGLMASIFNDDGGWTFNKQIGKIVYGKEREKGGFQVFYKNGIDVTTLPNLSFERPYFLREAVGYKLSSFENYGISYDNLISRHICPVCGETKAITINQRSSVRKSICMDCYENSLFTCSDCGNIYDKSDLRYEGKAYINRGINEVTLCPNCFKSAEHRRCQCCGNIICSNGYNETAEGGYVCNGCLNNLANHYRTCKVCGKVSRENVKSVYNVIHKTLGQYCIKHIPNIKQELEEIRQNNMFDSDRDYEEPYVECPICHNITSSDGRPCILCQETHGHEFEF